MFSSVESCRAKRAYTRLVASSIMAIRYSWGPRPSSQSCSLVSHCTSSPQQLRRARQPCTSTSLARPAFQIPPAIFHFRRVSLLTEMPCFSPKYSLASVGPKSAYSRWTRAIASRCVFSASLRLDFRPRRPCTTTASPFRFILFTSLRTHRGLTSIRSAAFFCVTFLSFPCFNQCNLSARPDSSRFVPRDSSLQLGGVKRNFLYCPKRNFSLCRDTTGYPLDSADPNR